MRTTPQLDHAVRAWDGHPRRPVGGPQALTVFQNPFVERWLARSHPILPGVWFGPLLVWGAWRALHAPHSLRVSLGGAALGLLVWTLLEYLLHRFVFHWVPAADNPSAKRRQFLLHGYHHAFPNDGMRLVAPPLMSWPIAALLAASYFVSVGPTLWFAPFCGTIIGYLAYDWIHYATHHLRPRTPVGRYLRQLHMIHHYTHHAHNHGISSPLWDWVFRTYQAPSSRSAHTRAKVHQRARTS